MNKVNLNSKEQQIIEKLNQSDGVLVQGPPGTGKSHTIANLICHLLAIFPVLQLSNRLLCKHLVESGHIHALEHWPHCLITGFHRIPVQ